MSSAYGPFWTTVVTSYLSGKTLKAMLVTPDYAFDKDHEFRSEVTDEVTGFGYTAGGITLTGVTAVWSSGLGRVVIDANDADFGTITITSIGGIVVYVALGSAATDRIISYHSFAPQNPSLAPFAYAWSVDGVGRLTV
jgi:hypothetical protein